MGITTDCVLRAGRTESGYCLRIVGRGTMNQSCGARDFVVRSLEGGGESLVIDLFECEYLDSTFLGCLVELHRRFNRDKPARLFVAAGEAKVRQLLHATSVDKVLKIVPTACACVGECIALPIDTTNDPAALSRHIMECHRRLAEIEGPNQVKFAMIADHLAAELGDTAGVR